MPEKRDENQNGLAGHQKTMGNSFSGARGACAPNIYGPNGEIIFLKPGEAEPRGDAGKSNAKPIHGGESWGEGGPVC